MSDDKIDTEIIDGEDSESSDESETSSIHSISGKLLYIKLSLLLFERLFIYFTFVYQYYSITPKDLQHDFENEEDSIQKWVKKLADIESIQEEILASLSSETLRLSNIPSIGSIHCVMRRVPDYKVSSFIFPIRI